MLELSRIGAAAVLLAAAAALSGCAHGPIMLAPAMQSGEDPRCEGAADQPSALIAEWSPAEKANLEQALRRGTVVVERSGCGLRVLPGCTVGGSYAWQRTGPAQASVEITDERSLFERLPLSAAALQADLRQAGKLRLNTQVAGDYRLQQGAPVTSEGECQRATHVVTAISVGASALTAGDGRLIRGAGDPNACAQGPANGPNPSCAAPLQLSLARIPGRGPEEPPPGMAQLDVVSDFSGQVWDVYAGEDRICTTPCTQWVDPMRPLFLEARGSPHDKLFVPGLGVEAMQSRNALVVATGSCDGKETVGITFTSLGGMGLIVGISLTAIGCSDLQRLGGMCNAGLITGGVSIPLTAWAIWMIVDAQPKVQVFPVLRAQPGRGQPPLTVGLGPGGIAGTF